MTVGQSVGRLVEPPAIGRRDGGHWVRTAGRIGIASRGVTYLLLAYLAFDVARHGRAPTQTSSTGALEELGGRPGGTGLLVVLAAGIGCYAAWRVFDAAVGTEVAAKRIASLAVGVIYVVLCVRAVTLVGGHSPSGGASSNPQPWVATVMHWSGGTVIVEMAGAVLAGAGVGLAVWGLVHRYDTSLALERLGRRSRTMVKVLGGVGDLARGALLVLVGVYLIDAAATSEPARAKSVDQALQALVHHSFGAAAIGLIALGLLSFGLYSFIDARIRRLSVSTSPDRT
jgi:uncharacterized membrane protein YidH (DUF202 family)